MNGCSSSTTSRFCRHTYMIQARGGMGNWEWVSVVSLWMVWWYGMSYSFVAVAAHGATLQASITIQQQCDDLTHPGPTKHVQRPCGRLRHLLVVSFENRSAAIVGWEAGEVSGSVGQGCDGWSSSVSSTAFFESLSRRPPGWRPMRLSIGG